MVLKYNKDGLKKVMSDFCNITGINVCLIDTEFNCIVDFPEKINSFCSLIQSAETGKKRCYLSDCSLLERCKNSRATVTHKCHAGLTDMIVPIYKGEMLLGFILLGQVQEEQKSKQNFEEIYENVKDLGIDKERLYEAYNKMSLFERSSIESAAEVVAMLTKYMLFEHLIDAENNDVASAISDYVEQHLDEKLSVASLCKRFNVSKNKLYNIFDANYQCGVKEYVDFCRIARAEQLLKTTQLSVYEIGVRCGMENYQNFCRFFKKQVGIPPLQYRKTNAVTPLGK